MPRLVARILPVLFALLTWSLHLGPVSVRATGSEISIRSPQAGEVLQGQVTITGGSDIAGFVSAEISFAYASDPTNTWFVISTSNQPVVDGTLAIWDTMAITDGIYTLRLRVYLADGTFLDVTIPDLRLRNYTPIETATPTVTPLVLTPLPSATPTATPNPTSTPLPPNPAALSARDVYVNLGYGALVATLFFILFGLYSYFRRR